MIEPIVKELLVPVSPEVAFRRFTLEIGTWWPIASYSVFPGESAGVEFDGRAGGLILETSKDGRQAEWGEVVAWEPPGRVAFTWYPGRTADTAQRVEVTFTAEAGGTRLRLVHGGWDVLGESAAGMREGYGAGWTVVLAAWLESLQVQV